MTKRRAYEEVKIEHNGHVVVLHPSLRAATILEDRFGIPALFKGMSELNLTIIFEIILACATGRQDAAAFLSSLRGRPLSPFFASVQAPLAELVSMFIPAPRATEVSRATSRTGKTLQWADLFADTYAAATGFLGWTPETAWNATPTEIDRACEAHLEKLNAIHGSETDAKTPDPEQAARNIAAGLDPEFDRAGLHALKGGRKAA